MDTTSAVELSSQQTNRRLKTALVLNTLVIAIELIGGFYANSLGILSDAIHNLIDEATLALTFYTYHMAVRPASGTRTFGHHKVEALAAWINAAALILVTLFLMAEAVRRLLHPQAVQGMTMIAVALAASLGNLAVALTLRPSAGENLNIKTAYLHNLGDAAISLSPVLGGLLIATRGWTAADPIIGLCIGVAVILGTWNILRQSTGVLLDRVPDEVETPKIVQVLLAMPGVRNVHDLHVWAVGSKLRLLTCQLLVEDMQISESHRFLRAVRSMLFERFGIGHVTIQLETTSCHPQVLYCNLVRRHFHQAGISTGYVTISKGER